MSNLGPRINKLFDGLFRKRMYLHLIFWLGFIAIFTFLNSSEYTILTSLASIATYSFGLAIAVYVNLLFLIPRLLLNKKYAIYFLALIAVMILNAPILTGITYFNSEYIHQNSQQLKEDITSFQVLIYSFINTSFLVGITTGLKFMSLWFSQQQKAREQEKQHLQSELTFLRSQINPHFLFNTLNNLYSLTLKKSDLAPEIVLKLSEMMRYMLYECNEKMVPLEKEINYVQSYIELEQLRKGDQTRITFNTQCQLNGQQIAPLLLIPFFENAFKHGINSQIDSGWVNIDLHVSGNYLDLQIANSHYPKINGKKSDSEHRGIGLKNVKRRLLLLYPDQHELTIQETEDTYSINLKIELS